MLERLSSLLRERARRSPGHGLVPRLATYFEYVEHARSLQKAPQFKLDDQKAQGWLSALDATGIHVVPNFWSAQQCARGRSEIDRIIAEYPRHIHGSAKSDVRVYGANNASAAIAEFAEDPALLALASAYNREPTRTAFTLAARMPATAGNHGSGEGWHRDAFFRQIKAILYLSDVSDANGPFQWVRASHRRHQLLRDMRAARLDYMQYRLSEAEVGLLLSSKPDREVTYSAAQGTLILVDTSSIHRGMPIREGTRYALTNYYFPAARIDASMFEKFKVLPGDAVRGPGAAG